MIATLDSDHAEPALALAGQGSALLIEKPLAPTEAECERIVAGIERAGVIAAVAHVMRYTPYTRLLRRVLDAGAVGEIVGIEHLEPVGYWHAAHSYVRGNWRREDQTGPMLLAKCCHDLDWLSHLVGDRCTSVASFGGRAEFRADRRPEGAGERCVACAIEPECAYSAVRLYRGMAERGDTGWPVSVLAWPPTVEHVDEALREGPYGRCVWASRQRRRRPPGRHPPLRARRHGQPDHVGLHPHARARDAHLRHARRAHRRRRGPRRVRLPHAAPRRATSSTRTGRPGSRPGTAAGTTA